MVILLWLWKFRAIGISREVVNLIFDKEAKMGTSKLALESLIQGFRLSCQAEGKSPRTVEWYTAFLTRFLRFLEASGFSNDLSQMTRDYIR